MKKFQNIDGRYRQKGLPLNIAFVNQMSILVYTTNSPYESPLPKNLLFSFSLCVYLSLFFCFFIVLAVVLIVVVCLVLVVFLGSPIQHVRNNYLGQ